MVKISASSAMHYTIAANKHNVTHAILVMRIHIQHIGDATHFEVLIIMIFAQADLKYMYIYTQ